MLVRRQAASFAAVISALLVFSVAPGAYATGPDPGGGSGPPDQGSRPEASSTASFRATQGGEALATATEDQDSAPEPNAGTVQRSSTGPVDIRVGTFNIKNVLFAKNPERDWKKRRQAVISQIRYRRVGILGIQEAHPGKNLGINYPDGANQYLDLLNGLNKAGSSYAITAAAPFNCVRPDAWQNCEYEDRGASRSTRILYDYEKFEVLDKGSVLYRKQTSEDRYLVWGIFRAKENGRKFLFTTTHLASDSNKVRRAQWRQMIRLIDGLRKKMPVVVTGDFNVQKYHPIAREMLPAMKSAGYGDVLNQQFGTNPGPGARAKKVVNAWINSYTHGRRDVKQFSFYSQRHKIGNGIDWIFASNRLEVKRYRVVCNYDKQTLLLRGVVPSDHNLVMADIVLP